MSLTKIKIFRIMKSNTGEKLSSLLDSLYIRRLNVCLLSQESGACIAKYSLNMGS